MPSDRVVRLYFDDTGSRLPDALSPHRADGMDCFALGGVLVAESDVSKIYNAHEVFINKWKLSGPLHSTKLRGFREQFRWLRDSANRQQFFSDLEGLLLSIPVLGIACAIDRPCYNIRYKERYGKNRWFMCKTAFSILIERSAKYADRLGAKLKIFHEACGKQEDRDLIAYLNDLKSNGMPFDKGSSAGYGGLQASDFRRIILGSTNRLTKKSGLVQIADLYLYPMMKGGYDPQYDSYQRLRAAGKIIDSILSPDEMPHLGIKYSCFDFKNTKSPEASELFGGPQMADPGADAHEADIRLESRDGKSQA